MLPVGGQGGVAIAPMGSAGPLGGLEAGEELTTGNLPGGAEQDSNMPERSFPEPGPAPPPAGHPSAGTDLAGGWGVRRAL